MTKVKHSRFAAKKRLTVTLVLSILLMLTIVLLMLFGFGVLSLPMNTDYDLASQRLRMASERGKGLGHREEQWSEVISWEPRASIYHNFLSKEECEYLIEIAKPFLRKSNVIDPTTGKSKGSSVRTSSGTFLERGQDEIISGIEKRIAEYSFMPVENGEGLQILHYEVGQKYDPHFDYFAEQGRARRGGQRMATMLMYLMDVEEGGETVFPRAKGNFSTVRWWDELSECGKKGLAVKPKMGDALLFWSMTPNATKDRSSLHGGCPVIKGDKWSCTKWMHVREY